MAGQKFTLTFDAKLDVNQMQSALKQIQTSLNGLQLPQNITKNLQGSLDNLKKSVQDFEVLIGKDITSKTDFKKIETTAQKITDGFEKLKLQIKDLTGLSNKDLEKLFPTAISDNIKTATTALNAYKKSSDNATESVKDQKDAVEALNKQIQQVQAKPLWTDQQKRDLTSTKNEVKALEDQLKTAQDNLANLTNKKTGKLIAPENYKKSSIGRTYLQEIDEVTKKLEVLRQKQLQLEQTKGISITATEQAKQLQKLQQDLTNAQAALTKLEQAEKQLNSTAAGGGLKKLLDDIGRLTGLDMSKFSQDAKGASNAIQSYLNQQLQKLNTNLQNTSATINNTSQPFNNLRSNVLSASDAFNDFNTRSREVEMLRSRIQYFFGLNNAIQLVRRTMREAYNTIKELDKAMTETAVVTDFSVGDMWAQLPEYTKRANELGVTTKAAYEAATLYYQQGLKTNEVMAMSNETLKMARIAGLDAAVATDRMTNAIRGFNMEINTTNAQRIDDVYSRLAAISASNVDEISTAMTKVASLAHNANMEFETTAAFLAQIIETTRESAETAGTALKTVVARFSEVKKLVGEDKLQGSDEEGEIIDVNKVSGALRTAGIDLNKYFLGEVGLDDIFIELASKWDSLTKMQQRYIATQAAGSRQQSRFIALMSDYARTQELVGEAYNANGAAAKQFAKTQESLESKLAKLKNAWNEFAMGILNSDIVKFGVDFLTTILNGVNALTSGFGLLNEGIGSVINTVAKLVVAFSALQLGRGIFGSIIGGKAAAATMMGLSGAKGNIFATLGAGLINPYVNTGSKIKSKVAGSSLAQQFSAYKAQQQVAYQAYEQMALQSMAVGAGNPYTKEMAFYKKQGLFNFLGTKFGSTKFGGGIAAGLGKVGTIFGGSGAAVSGATALATTLGVATAAAVALGVAIKKAYDASPAGQVKIAEKYATAMQSVATETKKASEEMQSAQVRYNELDEAVNNATSLEQKRAAIKERTEYVKSLLEQNETYSQYLEEVKFENGEIYLTLDSQKLEDACNKIAEAAIRSAQISNAADANLAYQEYERYLANVENYKSLRQTELELNGGFISDERNSYYERMIRSEQTLASEAFDRYMSSLGLSATKYLEQAELNLPSKFSNEFSSFLASAISERINMDDFLQAAKKNTPGALVSKDDLKALYYDYYGITLTDEDLKDKKKKKEVKNAIGAAIAVEDIFPEDTLEQPIIKAFLGLSETVQKHLVELYNNGQDLTKDDLEVISRADHLERYFADIWEFLDETTRQKIQDTSKNLSFNETISKNIGKYFLENSDISNSLTTFINWILDDFKLTLGETDTIASLFSDFAFKNPEGLGDFYTLINSLIKATDKKDLSKLFESLSNLKLDNPSNIKEVFKGLNDLDINTTTFGQSLDEASQKLIELAKSAAEFDVDRFKEEVSDTVSLMRDINERKNSKRTFSEADYKELILRGADPDQFVWSGIKNKEWTYVGQSLDDLVKVLADGLTDILVQSREQIMTQISEGERVRKILDDYRGLEEQINNIEDPAEIEEFRNNRIFQSIVGTDNALSLEPEKLLELITNAIINARPEQIEANKKELEAFDTYGTDPRNYVTDINNMVLRDHNEWVKGTDTQEHIDNTYTRAVNQKFYDDSDEHTEDRIDKYEDILKAIEKIDAATNKWNKTDQQKDTISKALAVNWANQAVKLEELTKVLDKNDKILSESTNDADEYSGAIHAVGEAMRAAYGEQVTDEFVEQHIKEIMLARESKEAYQELLDLLQQDFFSNAEAGADNFNGQLYTLQQALEEYGATAEQILAREYDGVAVLDGTPWMKVIYELFGNLEAFEAYLSTMGWTLVLDEIDDTTGLPKGAHLIRNNPTGFGGYSPYTGNGWGRGGNGSKGSQKEPTVWENDLDWLYNLMEDIAELQRQQTKLAEKHDRYLSDISKSGRDLYNITKEQLDNLKTEYDNQREALTRRRQELEEQLGTSGYTDYVWWNDEDKTIEIDWDAIEAIQDKDTYDEVKDLISKIETIQDQMDTAEDALWDIEGKIKELEDRYLQEYTEFQQRIFDAVVASYQRQIDKLSSLNDTLNDTNAKILESLQQEIDYSRQIRDNTDTERNISDMEARLAYLRRDTTGANESQIRDLEKQLEDARQGYEDTLIDQSLERLSEENAKAAEQRQQQIDLLTAQLQYWQESGELWAEVAELMAGGINDDGSLIRGSQLEEMLKDADSWKAMSQEQREVWANELINQTAVAGAYLIKISEGLEGISAGIHALIPETSLTDQKLQYASGGLNTKTGWAWLDGTASEPEYVLNARQTDAFMKLSEVLPAMFESGGSISSSVGGDVYIELSMNIGGISSDYDVDRMVDRIKSDIYDASSFRNLTSISRNR